MIKKPAPEEFLLSEAGIRHTPTEAMFIPYPADPAHGTWRQGNSEESANYQTDEVRELGRKLWEKFLNQKVKR